MPFSTPPANPQPSLQLIWLPGRRSKSLVDELRPELPERSKKAQVPYCVCLAWSADGSTLYSGEWEKQWAAQGQSMREGWAGRAC